MTRSDHPHEFAHRARRIAAGAVVLAVVTSVGSAGIAHAESDQDRRDRLESALKTSQDSLANSKAEAATAQQNLTSSQARLASQQAVLEQAQADLAAAKKQDARLAVQLSQAQQKLQAANDAVSTAKTQLDADRKKYATSMNRLVQQSSPLQGLAVFTSNLTTNDVNQRTQWSAVATGMSKQAVEEISRKVVELQDAEKQQAAATRQAADRKKASAAHLQTTKTLEQEASSAADAVAATVKLNAAVAAQKQAQLDADRAATANLKNEVAKVNAAIKQAAARKAAAAAAEAQRQAEAASNKLASAAASAERTSYRGGRSASSTAGSYAAVANYNGVDPWGFYWGQCVSYAAWKVRTTTDWSSFQNYTNGVHFGNAVNWGAAARAIGVRVDTSPSVGSVAWRTSGYAGHVAWVTAVHGDGTIDVSEYNFEVPGGFDTRSHVNWSAGGSTGFDGFIHF
jgi:surface antigen